ncbi:tRNA guanosine(34) transglycosylase Tgt [Spirochaetota bacterium]
MNFKVIKKEGQNNARIGEITTSRGKIMTPVFMPVATRGAIRALTNRDMEELDFDIILSNTYHLYIRPGIELLELSGGLHKFMNYNKPILTDSGGFQVFSMADLCKIQENGVEFRSHLDGSLHFFSPQKVLDIQKVIGSDIMMVLDQCVEYPVEKKAASDAVERTFRWAEESICYWKDNFDTDKQALFGIIQGSVFNDLRKDCLERIVDLDFPGYAIGGLSVGEPKDLYREVAEFTLPMMPEDKPRYMMGVGSPMEILYAVKHGVDMFDCVMPTRIARNGTLFTTTGRVNIKSSKYEKDFNPIDENCKCYVCRNYSRSYLRHLFRVGEIAALIYNSYHNLYFMKYFLEEIRDSIVNGNFNKLYKKYDSIYGQNNQ